MGEIGLAILRLILDVAALFGSVMGASLLAGWFLGLLSIERTQKWRRRKAPEPRLCLICRKWVDDVPAHIAWHRRDGGEIVVKR
jgi:hypothetical protein